MLMSQVFRIYFLVSPTFTGVKHCVIIQAGKWVFCSEIVPPKLLSRRRIFQKEVINMNLWNMQLPHLDQVNWYFSKWPPEFYAVDLHCLLLWYDLIDQDVNNGVTSYSFLNPLLLKIIKNCYLSGNLRLAVMLPEGEDINEWVAVNTVDFFNQV